jgi:hypothetical protein
MLPEGKNKKNKVHLGRVFLSDYRQIVLLEEITKRAL